MTSDLHGLNQQTVSRIRARVTRAIAKLAPNYINIPSTVKEEVAQRRLNLKDKAFSLSLFLNLQGHRTV